MAARRQIYFVSGEIWQGGYFIIEHEAKVNLSPHSYTAPSPATHELTGPCWPLTHLLGSPYLSPSSLRDHLDLLGLFAKGFRVSVSQAFSRVLDEVIVPKRTRSIVQGRLLVRGLLARYMDGTEHDEGGIYIESHDFQVIR